MLTHGLTKKLSYNSDFSELTQVFDLVKKKFQTFGLIRRIQALVYKLKYGLSRRDLLAFFHDIEKDCADGDNQKYQNKNEGNQLASGFPG